MEKRLFFLLSMLFALALTSCEPDVKAPVAGKTYWYYYEYDASSHCYYYFGDKGTGHYSINTDRVDYIIDFYYTFESNKIKMYKDKKLTNLWASGNYFDSYITIDGEDGEQYVLM